MNFSVLQSVYKNDRPEFLDKALESISNQTLLPTEIVLVKDGEIPEQLLEVITKWKKFLPIKFIGYSENKGLAHALNYGLSFITTELVARMVSDDICYSERFEKQIFQFENDQNLVILGTGIEEFYDNRNFKQLRLYPEFSNKKSKSLYKGTPLAHPTVMVKTEILKKFLYNEKTKCNEDIELWFRLLMNNYDIKTLQEPLLHFRITDGTFKRRSIKKAINEFCIYYRALHKINGFSKFDFFLILRLATRFMPSKINKRLYLSTFRKKIFK